MSAADPRRQRLVLLIVGSSGDSSLASTSTRTVEVVSRGPRHPSSSNPTASRARRQRPRWRRYALPAAVAVAVVALALSIVSLAVGASGGTTRVERTPEIVSSKGDGLDATAIYRQDAPGVPMCSRPGSRPALRSEAPRKRRPDRASCPMGAVTS